MPFNLQFWGKISTTGNSEFRIQEETIANVLVGTCIVEGAPAQFSYSSTVDTFTQILATDVNGNMPYFHNTPVFADLKLGDVIYISTFSEERFVTVTGIDYVAKTIVLEQAAGGGNVSNVTDIAGVVDNAVAIFDGTTGKLIRQSVMVVAPPPALDAAYRTRFVRPASPDPNVVLKGIEGLEFRDLAGFIWLTDGLDTFGIMGLFMEELFAKRCILISDGASVPSSFDAILELNTNKGTFLPPRLTTVQRDDLENPLPGMQFYNITLSKPQIYTGGSWEDIVTGSANGVTSLSQGYGITLSTNPITTTGTIYLANLGTAGVVPYPASISVDGQGRVDAYTAGVAPVTSVSGTASNISSSGGTTPVINLIDTAVTPGTYTNATLTVDQKGRLTAASSLQVARLSIYYTGTMQTFPSNGMIIGPAGTLINFNSANANTVVLVPPPFLHSNGVPATVNVGGAVFDYIRVRAVVSCLSGGVSTDAVQGALTLGVGGPIGMQETFAQGTFCVDNANSTLNAYFRTAVIETILPISAFVDTFFLQLKVYVSDAMGAWGLHNAYFEIEVVG